MILDYETQSFLALFAKQFGPGHEIKAAVRGMVCVHKRNQYMPIKPNEPISFHLIGVPRTGSRTPSLRASRNLYQHGLAIVLKGTFGNNGKPVDVFMNGAHRIWDKGKLHHVPSDLALNYWKDKTNWGDDVGPAGFAIRDWALFHRKRLTCMHTATQLVKLASRMVERGDRICYSAAASLGIPWRELKQDTSAAITMVTRQLIIERPQWSGWVLDQQDVDEERMGQ